MQVATSYSDMLTGIARAWSAMTLGPELDALRDLARIYGQMVRSEMMIDRLYDMLERRQATIDAISRRTAGNIFQGAAPYCVALSPLEEALERSTAPSTDLMTTLSDTERARIDVARLDEEIDRIQGALADSQECVVASLEGAVAGWLGAIHGAAAKRLSDRLIGGNERQKLLADLNVLVMQNAGALLASMKETWKRKDAEQAAEDARRILGFRVRTGDRQAIREGQEEKRRHEDLARKARRYEARAHQALDEAEAAVDRQIGTVETRINDNTLEFIEEIDPKPDSQCTLR